MMAVDDVGRKITHRTFNSFTKGPRVPIDLSRRECCESGAWIRHDVTHTGNAVIQHALVEVNKTAGLRVDAVKLRQPVTGDSGNKIILMAGHRCLADNILKINTAAGTFRMLT